MSTAYTDDNLSKMIAYHDRWADTYDSGIAGMVLYNRITLDNIRRFLPDVGDGVILDAGGGTGFWATQLAEMGYRVVLTDVSTGMLERARENVNRAALQDRIEIRTAEIRSMPEFADEQFAMVLCQGDPLSYCGDHEAAMRELARVVCVGGVVIASVDNRASGINLLREAPDLDAVERLTEKGEIEFPAEREEFRYMIHAFTPQELANLVESNGLSVERIIGKTVIAQRLAARDSEDPAVQERLYQIELKYCDDPAYLPWAGHLEIAGRKR